MGKTNYDFSGYATRNGLRCSDGRIIFKDAFAGDNGKTVPLVWMHGHSDNKNVLGHAYLENREDGVYCYCSFNGTENGQLAKDQVEHGDIKHLSIYATKLEPRGSAEVKHGEIKEVSLVLAGANPGAFIDNVTISHSDGSESVIENEGIIYTNDEIELFHADSDNNKEDNKDMANEKETNGNDSKTIQEVVNTMSKEQKDAMYALIGMALEDAKKGGEAKHSEEGSTEDNVTTDVKDSNDDAAHAKETTDATPAETAKEGEGKTLKDVIDTMSKEQKDAMYAMIGLALENKDGKNGDAMKHSDEMEGENFMKENVFENAKANGSSVVNYKDVLEHSEIEAIFKDARKCGSLRDSVMAHVDALCHSDGGYGITGIENLFPEAMLVNKEPNLIKREDAWVKEVMDGITKVPFAKIKSTAVNITATEARAKGYVKKAQKIDEVITALKRTADPQTIYKKQALDEDDILDITDFDVVVYLKNEMKIMLKEEIARAIIIGDGRASDSPDKINPAKIIPMYGDSNVYTIYKTATISSSATEKDQADEIIRQALHGREDYKGSGNVIALMAPSMLTTLLLAQDDMGHYIYDSADKLATRMRVNRIIEVPVMNETRRTSGSKTMELITLIVDLKDYSAGTNKGGQTHMFEDFDIDYNKHKYLMETRMSGMNTRPYSCIAIEKEVTVTAG